MPKNDVVRRKNTTWNPLLGQLVAQWQRATNWISRAWRNAQLLFVISLLLLVTSIGLLVITTRRLSHQPTRKAAQPAAPFAVASDISSGLVTVTVESVQFAGTQGNFVAADGEHFVLIGLKVRNNSDQPIQILPSSDTYLKDASGHVTYLTPYRLDNPFRAGELPPGETVRGELSYIASTVGQHKLFIDAKWSGSVLPFKID